MRLAALLRLLYPGVVLAWVLAWMMTVFFSLWALLDVFVVLGGHVPSLAPLLSGLVLWTLSTALGFGHLRAALGRAQRVGPLDGEVAQRVAQGARWLMLGGVVSLVVLAVWSRFTGDAAAVWTPSELLSTLLSLALPLLLLGLSGWLDEGRRLRDRAREVV